VSAWTNGKIHVVVGSHGLSVHRGERVELILANSQLGSLPPKKGKSGFARIHPLTVAGEGKFAFTIDAERKLVRAALDGKGPCVKYPWDITDLAPADGQRIFAAYVTGTKARALTSIVLGVPPADPKGKWEHEYEGERPQKVIWPDELLWDKAPWSRKTRWTTEPDLLHVDHNLHGYAVTDTDSAVVGVLRRAKPTTPPAGFNAVLRTPKDKGTTVAATLTAKGVLVATCKPDGDAVICEFDDAGKILAHRLLQATSISPLAHAGERIFALVEHRKIIVLGVDLQSQAELELGELPPSQVRLRAHADGQGFLLTLANKVVEGILGATGWATREFDLSGVPDPDAAHEAVIVEAEITASAEPIDANGKPIELRSRIITQAPRLSLDPNQPNEAWTFVVAEDFEIVLNAVSVGGPSETGLYVEISGDALAKGLITPKLVSIEGRNEGRAPFERHGGKFLAVLPDFRLPAGVEPFKDKKIKPKERFLDNPEDTFLTIRLSGSSNAAGAGELVYLRVGFEGAGQEGSLMRGRPITVYTVRPVAPPPEPEPEPELQAEASMADPAPAE